MNAFFSTMKPLILTAGFIGTTLAASPLPVMVSIPAGTFEMGDHSGLGGEDPKHPSDERPLHTVSITAFSMGKYTVTNAQYRDFLNESFTAGKLTVDAGIVRAAGGADTLFRTSEGTAYSRISFAGNTFSVKNGKSDHPVTDVRWLGAAAYCNWLSIKLGYGECYNLISGDCDFTANGFRLPTEAEWEYAAYGGRSDYPVFPWGSDTAAAVYGLYANWENSHDPYEGTDTPFTTPVGFYDGTLRSKTDYNWPAPVPTCQTRNGCNGFGLFDMSGNVWQLCNDWYSNPYYAQSSFADPTGPSKTAASSMPDGKPYRCMRGGSWFNGQTMFGHGRASNRNPSYFRGPGDPNGPWFHIGFRVVTRSGAATPVNHGALRGTGSLPFIIPPNNNTGTELSLFGIDGRSARSTRLDAAGIHRLAVRLATGCYVASPPPNGDKAATGIVIIGKGE